MPVYNEAKTVSEVASRVLQQPETSELILIDDGSTDETWPEILKISDTEPHVKIFQHPKNQGKGAALRTGIKQATKVNFISDRRITSSRNGMARRTCTTTPVRGLFNRQPACF